MGQFDLTQVSPDAHSRPLNINLKCFISELKDDVDAVTFDALQDPAQAAKHAELQYASQAVGSV